MGKKVWANSPDVPIKVCSDARLRGNENLQEDKPFGQAGWTDGITFKNLEDLAEQLLNTFGKGKVTKLAINAHGAPGQFLPAGRRRPDLAVNIKTIPIFHKHLHNIGLSITQDATIMIAGCICGEGSIGTEFLKKLSMVWPKRLVVGFVTLGYSASGEQKRPGQGCNEPGMRDTNEHYSFLKEEDELPTRSLWKNLSKLPWASPTSPHAKCVRTGAVVRSPEPPPKPRKLVRNNKELFRLWKKYKSISPSNKPARSAAAAEFMSLKTHLERKEKVEYVNPK
jgi:hypothetical protein